MLLQFVHIWSVLLATSITNGIQQMGQNISTNPKHINHVSTLGYVVVLVVIFVWWQCWHVGIDVGWRFNGGSWALEDDTLELEEVLDALFNLVFVITWAAVGNDVVA